jgi:hypothetical protein
MAVFAKNWRRKSRLARRWVARPGALNPRMFPRQRSDQWLNWKIRTAFCVLCATSPHAHCSDIAPSLILPICAASSLFPDQRNCRARNYFAPFRLPFVSNLIGSLKTLNQITRNGYTECVKLRWVRTSFGGNYRPRPLFICTNRGRSIANCILREESLNSRRCSNAVHASQSCDKHIVPFCEEIGPPCDD